MSIVYIGADHRGYQLKEHLMDTLRQQGITVENEGAKQYDPDDDFTDFALKLAKDVIQDNAKGILICGSGVGVAIVANKISGVRAGLCMSEKQAQLARSDDDINILCLSADLVDQEENERIVETFLNTIFSSGEKYVRRINKIKQYESKKC